VTLSAASPPFVDRIRRLLEGAPGEFRSSPWPSMLALGLVVGGELLTFYGNHVRAQTLVPAAAGDQPSFEVASVKRNGQPDGPRLFQALPGGRVNLVNQTVRELIYSAYQTQEYRIIGGPAWLSEDRFDIAASAGTDAPPPQMLLMVRTLLADRFRLGMRRETRELPVYRLVMARADRQPGPQLKPSTCSPDAAGSPGGDGPAPCMNRGGPGSLISTGATLDTLANRLGRLPVIGRPVVNQTGLSGRFDVELSFTPDQTAGPASDAISVFTALQEQLGVKLESARGPIEVLVIERVERPEPD
jgi:uncharacterized protein (TIGR03435 family)